MKKLLYNTYIQKPCLLAGMFLALTGCKKDDVDWYRPIGNPLSSNVKFVNTLPSSRMDFFTYNTKITSGISYGDTAMPYVKTPFGNIIVYGTNFNQTSFRVTGNTNSGTPQMSNQGLVADFFQTMFACKTTDSAAAETMLLIRDNLAAPAAGKAHIRFVHLAQRGATQVRRLDLVAAVGPQTGAIFSGLRFQIPSNGIRMIPTDSKSPATTGLNTPGLGIYTSGPYTPVDAGAYTFDVKTAGTEDVVTSKVVTLVSGKIYTLYTVGIIGATGPTAVSLKVLGH